MEPCRPQPPEPLLPGDDMMLIQLVDIFASRLRQLLTQGTVAENNETIHQTQRKIDILRQQVERLRVVLRKTKDRDKSRRDRNH